LDVGFFMIQVRSRATVSNADCAVESAVHTFAVAIFCVIT